MIPALLTQRYELIQALDQARDLRHALRAGGIEGQELQFITEKIQSLEAELSETEAEAQVLIDRIDNAEAKIYTTMHFNTGYQWSEIAEIFDKRDATIKACAYRALHRLSP